MGFLLIDMFSTASAHGDSAPRFIAVEGPIGAGKSTLAELLGEAFGANLMLERFEDNPFLPLFYEDPKHTAFQTQMFFLLSRFRQHQDLLQTDLFYSGIVMDYLFAKDRIFASINLTEDELKLYDQIERGLGRGMALPDVVIYLQSSVPRLEENIRRRSRDLEKHISSEYLDTLVRAYNDFFFHYRDTRLIVVDTGTMDFVRRSGDLDRIVATILREPHPPVEYLAGDDDSLFMLKG